MILCINVQFAILDEAANLFSNVNWWIKADGVDVVAGLGESVGGK